MSNAPTKEATPLGSTWYRLSRYSYEVQERTVTKSTSQTVWFRDVDYQGKDIGRIFQERKGGDWYPTKKEALAELRKRLEREAQQAQNRYSVATERLKKFNAQHAGELG